MFAELLLLSLFTLLFCFHCTDSCVALPGWAFLPTARHDAAAHSRPAVCRERLVGNRGPFFPQPAAGQVGTHHTDTHIPVSNPVPSYLVSTYAGKLVCCNPSSTLCPSKHSFIKNNTPSSHQQINSTYRAPPPSLLPSTPKHLSTKPPNSHWRLTPPPNPPTTWCPSVARATF